MTVINKTLIFVGLTALIHGALSANIKQAPSPASSTGLFAADLLTRIAKDKSSENVIFSPISIQTALAMVYLGAAGNTAEEMRNGLHLANGNVDEIGSNFARILNQKSGEAELKIANRMFVNSDYQLQPQFNERSQKYFKSEAEKMDFNKKAVQSTEAINTWVEQNTNNKIKDLLQKDSVNPDTAAVIVNAIYFKGLWQEPFSKSETRKRPFWNNQEQSVDVDTMYGSEYFKYGEFPELDAVGIEMPYKNSNISMLLLLPNQKNGLATMESKMGSVSLTELGTKMSERKVELSLPKFKVEFKTGLVEVLKEMGMHSLFDNAQLPGIFESGPAVKVSDAQHKAYIEVNEAGSEAAAASFVIIHFLSLNSGTKFLNVDHPFLFAIKSPDTVYFVGHIAKL